MLLCPVVSDCTPLYPVVSRCNVLLWGFFMIPQKPRLEDILAIYSNYIYTACTTRSIKIHKNTTMGDGWWRFNCYVLLFIVILTYSDCELADVQLQRQAALPYSGTLIPPPQMVLWRHDMRHHLTYLDIHFEFTCPHFLKLPRCCVCSRAGNSPELDSFYWVCHAMHATYSVQENVVHISIYIIYSTRKNIYIYYTDRWIDDDGWVGWWMDR